MMKFIIAQLVILLITYTLLVESTVKASKNDNDEGCHRFDVYCRLGLKGNTCEIPKEKVVDVAKLSSTAELTHRRKRSNIAQIVAELCAIYGPLINLDWFLTTDNNAFACP